MSRFASRSLLILLAASASSGAWANNQVCPCDGDEKPAEASHWTGGGELGFASARGNSINESLNGRFNVQYTQGDWIHSMDLFGLRARAEYRVEDEEGGVTREAKTTANRYTFGANSALKLGEHRQFTTALRAEQDDFATYDWQQTASVGYGTRMMDGERTKLDVQLGPGFRRAHNAQDDQTESGLIGRGFVGLKFDLTENTELSNNLLVESGSHNTYAQNDLGVSVAMNSHLALKAGLQARRNSDVEVDRKKTDTLTTMNVVYRFK
jgi:putative salt-induced outer membrane protein